MSASSGVIFGLFGLGGCARSIMPFARDIVARDHPGARIVFVDTYRDDKSVNSFDVLKEEEFLALPAKKYFNIGISDSKLRQRVAETCLAQGCIPLDLHAPDALAYAPNSIGAGSILCARTMITVNATIGKFFHANIYGYIEHDCVIGDYVTFAPRVSCNGTVHIGDHAYIGTGAILRQGKPGEPLTIGEGAVIGMGAVVTKNVPPGATVIGNPAKIME
jgi:sugar O-acyltransferase (sialic acid O-acetyltransferase NeuD family)